MANYSRFDPEELILRDELALDRTRLANERTLLAYLRTSIMLLVSGGTIIKLFGDQTEYVVAAWIIMAMGVVVGVVGFVRFISVSRSIRKLFSTPK
jgi:putative membrane protein